MPRRSIWKGSFVDAFLLRMKKREILLLKANLLLCVISLCLIIAVYPLGIPLVIFADDGDEARSEQETEAGVGAQESIEAGPQEEGAPNLDAEPSSRKRRADPWEDVGPSSVRRKVDSGMNCDKQVASSDSESWRQYLDVSSDKEGDSASEPSSHRAPALGGADPQINSRMAPKTHPGSSNDVGPSDPMLMETALRLIREEDAAQDAVVNELLRLRTEEHMQKPGARRIYRVAEMLQEENEGISFNQILAEIKENGLGSKYYKQSKDCFNHLRRCGVSEEELRRDWEGKGEG